MIRLILVAIFVLLYLICFLPVLLVEFILRKHNPTASANSSKAIVGWAFRCIQFLSGTKLIVKGQENIPTDTAVLYVGNHRSYFDIILSLSLFPRSTGYVAKVEMKKFPILNLWMKAIRCLFLDRENIKEGLKTILEGVDEVKNGYSLCIFPEGTRNRTEEDFLPFHEGSFKIAEKGKVPVVPMTIVNSGAVFENHLPFIKKATVVIEFSKPIYIDTLDRDEKKALTGNVRDIISKTYFANKEEYNL